MRIGRLGRIGRMGGGGRRPPFDYYVDSVAGSDSNNGRSAAAPFATISALTPYLRDSLRIGLARGSVWREGLVAPSYSGLRVAAYGESGNTPRLSTLNPALNANFTKTAGRTNAYQIAWTHSIANDGLSFLTWHEDGEPLAWVSSLATLDATPGTFTLNGGSLASSPVTVYVHPRGSTNPITDGKSYAGSARTYALYLGDSVSVADLCTEQTVHNNGSLIVGRNSLVERCLTKWGTKHHALGKRGTRFVDHVAYGEVPAGDQWGGGRVGIVIYDEAATGSEAVFDGVVVDGSEAQALYAHTNGDTDFAAQRFRRCYLIGGTAGYGFGNALVGEITDCYGEDLVGCVQRYNSSVTVAGLTLVRLRNNFRALDGDGPWTVADMAVQAADANAASGGIVRSAGDHSISHSSIDVHNGSAMMALTGAAGVVATTDNIVWTAYPYNWFNGAGPPTSSDRSVYWHSGSNMVWNIAAGSYNGLAALRAAIPAMDAGSTQANPLWAGSTQDGDFSVQAGSPALSGGRNAGARRWVTRPDLTALRAEWAAGRWAHPRGSIGGSAVVTR